MKHFVKAALGLVSLVILFIVCVLLINAFDESLSAQAKKAQEPLPAVAGFALKNFKSAAQEDATKDPLKIPLITYQDYKNSPAGYEDDLQKRASSLKALQDAFEAGAPEQASAATFKDSLVFYPLNLQPVFLIHVSQLLKAGNYSDAYSELEKSNSFLAKMIQSPQTLVNTMIGLAALKKNANFFESLLKEDFAPSIPESLRQSFILAKSADEIYALTMKKELDLATTFVRGATLDELELANFGEPSDLSIAPTPKPMSSRFHGRVAASLFRKHQTMNWFAAIHDELLSDVCKEQKEITCSPTFKQEIAHAGIKFYLVNPVGRGLVQALTPRYLGHREKIANILKEVKDLTNKE